MNGIQRELEATLQPEPDICRHCGVDAARAEHAGGCPERDRDDYESS